MNERQPYERLIAEKLRQLPVPDVDKSWRQMNRLLDDEPTPGGGGPGRGFRPGKTWWWTGLSALILTTGIWIFTQPAHNGKAAIASVKKETKGHSSVERLILSHAAGSSVAIHAAVPGKPSPQTQKFSIDQKSTLTGFSNTGKEILSPGNKPKEKPVARTGTNPLAHPKITGHRETLDNRTNSSSLLSAIGAAPRHSTGTGQKKANGNFEATKVDRATAQNSGYAPVVPGIIAIPYNPANTTVLPAGTISPANDGYSLLSSAAKAAAKRRQLEALSAKKSKRERNGLQLARYFQPFSLKNSGDDWWAVGLSLNNALSVGDQVHINYNINARPGIVSDYIPSPFVQYHVNNNVYLQTELNLSAPQNTPQLLVARDIYDRPGSADRTEVSTYVRKLYYFNWPVSLHYSPFRNFYLAGGLQFSSLQSGVAMTASRSLSPFAPAAQSYSGDVYKFKDDSTAAKLSPNEWRWQTGADYYINRFTLGFRYNRAFKDVVNLRFLNTATVSRNSAFLLFLKYNLFESRKPDKDNGSQGFAGY